MDWLSGQEFSVDELSAVVVRTAAAVNCTKSGTYLVNQALRDDMYRYFIPDKDSQHPSTMVLPLADELIGERDIPIYIVDSTHVDEFSELAKMSGHPDLPRESNFHALNQKAVARKAATDMGKSYNKSRMVVAHLGGGVSIGAHEYGKVIDTCSGGLDQDGPFSPNRTGRLPLGPLVDLCYSGKYTHKEMTELLIAKGGFYAYTGTTDVREVEKRAAAGDQQADLVLRAFCYQVAKEIAAQCAVLSCHVDAIVLTGGLAYSERITQDIKERVFRLAPVKVYPGEEEGPAMVAGALRVLRGEEEAIIFQ